ncbi:MAG: type IV pilin-like G/H family protein [Cyanobacteria bacterium P01_F01_bin.4]
MKSTFTTKLLQHLSKKKQEGGFTLIELLVVIIIIGILAAIALPSFLNQANKAKQSEAKTYVGSMNRSQQAYFLENSEFADAAAFSDLGLGISKETANYDYSITRVDTGEAYQVGSPEDTSGDASIKAYVGLALVGTVEGTGEATTLAVLCEADKAPIEGGIQPAADGTTTPAGTWEVSGQPECADGYKDLGR